MRCFATSLKDEVLYPVDDAGLQGTSGFREVPKYMVPMWQCEPCGRNNFADRVTCYVCQRAKSSRVRVVEEVWRADALPKRGMAGATQKGNGKAEREGGQGGQSQRRKGGNKGDGKGGAVAVGQLESRRGEEVGRGKGWIGLAPGQNWADADDLQESYDEEGQIEQELWEEIQRGKRKGWRGRRTAQREALGQSQAVEGQRAGGKRHEGSTTGSKGVERGGRTETTGGRTNTGGKGVITREGEGDAGKGVARWMEGVEEDTGIDEDEGEHMVEAPFQPPLPRRLLAGRLGALESRSEQLNEAGDPRKKIAQEKLERTRKELREAGGRTSKRLYFSLVSGEDRIKKAGAEVQAAEEVLQKKEEELRAAEASLKQKRDKLQREKAAHAFRGFQAAAEAAQDVEGFGELRLAVQKCGEMLARCGNECESEWTHIANFVATFAPWQYASSEDSELADLRSVAASSTPGATEPEDEAGERNDILVWEQQAVEEHAIIQKAHTEPITEDQRIQLVEAMGVVHREANRAAKVAQEMYEEQKRRADNERQEERSGSVGGGNGASVALAIMDAVEHKVPSSSSSGGEAEEPKRKRRGREVQVVGGPTAGDVHMEKGRKGDEYTGEESEGSGVE